MACRRDARGFGACPGAILAQRAARGRSSVRRHSGRSTL